MRADRRHDGDPYALALQAFHQRPEVAVPGKQNDVVDMQREFHGVDRNLDIHVPLYLAALLGLVEMQR